MGVATSGYRDVSPLKNARTISANKFGGACWPDGMRKFFDMAIRNITKHGDTDILPFPIENHIFSTRPVQLLTNWLISISILHNASFNSHLRTKVPLPRSTTLDFDGPRNLTHSGTHIFWVLCCRSRKRLNRRESLKRNA